MTNPFKPSTKFEPIVFDCDPDVYGALKDGEFGTARYLLRRTELWKFSQCPSKFAAQVPQAATRSLDWGTLLDALYLSPERFHLQYVVTPAEYPALESRKKFAANVMKPWSSRAAYCVDWEEVRTEAGMKVVPFDTYQQALLAVQRLRDLPNVQKFRDASRTSVRLCMEYADEATGLVLQLKALLDLVPREGTPYAHALGDLKTAKSAAGHAWRRHLFQFGYHYQGALYLDAWNAVANDDRTDFLHVVSENTPPYEPAQRFLSVEFLEIGRAQYRRDLAFYCQCLKAKQWPGYTDEAATRIVIEGGWHIVEPEPWMLQAAFDQTFNLPSGPASVQRRADGLARPGDEDEEENIP